MSTRTTDIRQVQQALRGGQAVQAVIGTRNVDIASVNYAADGSLVCKWSHANYPESHIDTFADGTVFEIFEEGTTPHRR